LETTDASDSDEDYNDRKFEVGDWVDCLDSMNRWLCAKVMRVSTQKALLRLEAWGDVSEEWIHMSDTRIARMGTYTSQEQREKRGEIERGDSGEDDRRGRKNKNVKNR